QVVAEPVARAVLVTAAPGIGKSRLRRELVARAGAAHPEAWVLTGRGDPMSAGSLFGVVSQIVTRAAGIRDGDDARVRHDKLAAMLGAALAGDELAATAELLGELIGAPAPGPPSPALISARNEPRLFGEQLRAAWEQWLAAECRRRPVV